MDFLIEMLFWILGALILEPVLFYIIDKFQKKKVGLKPIKKIDPDNFIVKHGKDMKGLALILGIFMGISILLPLIVLPFAKNDSVSKSELIFMMCIFTIMLAVVIYLMFGVLAFKIVIRKNKLYIYNLFKLKEFDIKPLTTQVKKQGFYYYFLVFITAKEF